MAQITTEDAQIQMRSGALEGIRRFDRQATLEQVLAYLAHSLGSPLNVIEGRAAMMASGQVVDAEVRRNARIIGEQSSRMAKFLREVVTFSRRQLATGAPRLAAEATAELGAIAAAAVTVLGPTARARDATILLEGEGQPARVRGSAESLLVAITHVLENGIRATPRGGTLIVRVREDVAKENGRDVGATEVPFYCVEVDDEGPGIQPDVLPRLFKPFTTTRAERQAIGLGLFIAQSIAREHGGWLEGGNRSGAGARFILHLPQGVAHA